MAPCECTLSLRDLVNDPLTRLLMNRDGVDPADLVRLMTKMKRTLDERRRHDPAGAGRRPQIPYTSRLATFRAFS